MFQVGDIVVLNTTRKDWEYTKKELSTYGVLPPYIIRKIIPHDTHSLLYFKNSTSSSAAWFDFRFIKQQPTKLKINIF